MVGVAVELSLSAEGARERMMGVLGVRRSAETMAWPRVGEVPPAMAILTMASVVVGGGGGRLVCGFAVLSCFYQSSLDRNPLKKLSGVFCSGGMFVCIQGLWYQVRG